MCERDEDMKWHLKQIFFISIVCLQVLCILAFPISDCVIAKDTSDSILTMQQTEGCDIVFLLDISGSMKNTDPNRISIDIMKMMTDICSSGNNRVGFVGYNDTIAYSYSLIDAADKKKRTELKNYIGNVEFKGETDIGLGLKKSVSMLSKGKNNNRTPIICMLSDGETDLANSNTGRTEEQSQDDVEQSISAAKKNNIKIYTVGLNNQFSEILDYLETISKQTNGQAYAATSPFQLLEIINGIMANYQTSALVNQTTELANGKIQKFKVKLPQCSLRKYRMVILSSSKIETAGILEENERIKKIGNAKFYTIFEIEKPKNKELTLYYKTKKGAAVSMNTQGEYEFTGTFEMKDKMNTGENAELTFWFADGQTGENLCNQKEFKDLNCTFYAIHEDTKTQVQISVKQDKEGYFIEFIPREEGKYYFLIKYKGSLGEGFYKSGEYEIKNKEPQTVNKLQNRICIQKDKQYNLNKIFENKFNKEMEYSVVLEDGDSIVAKIDKDTLKIHGKQLGTQKVKIIAETEKEKYQIDLTVYVGTFWEIYQEYIIAAAIGSIVCFTILIYFLLYLIQKNKKKKALEKEFCGTLIGYFTDVKSANDLPMMAWRLENYPGVGVTLYTLLKEGKVKDYFLGAERIWIYPYNESKITIVHNLQGSIFLGNKLVEKNIPVHLCDGDVIYVCFEENGAEIELHYRNTGGLKNGRELE